MFRSLTFCMARSLALSLALSVLILTTLLSAQAPRASGCASTPAVSDLCYAPGSATPDRVAVKKPCLSCVLGADAGLPAAPLQPLHTRFAPADRQVAGRPVLPDDRPPRA